MTTQNSQYLPKNSRGGFLPENMLSMYGSLSAFLDYANQQGFDTQHELTQDYFWSILPQDLSNNFPILQSGFDVLVVEPRSDYSSNYWKVSLTLKVSG